MKTLRKKVEVGQVFNKLTVISKAEPKLTYKRKEKFWNCACECGREIVVSSSKLGVNISCGCKDVVSHDGLSMKHRYIYKKWHHFKQTNRLSQEFLEFKTFLDYVLENLGDRVAEYAYLSPKDENNLVSLENITWKYLQHAKTFCDTEYKWCSNCERYIQNSYKFWTKKKGNFCRKCIFSYSLKSKYNLEYKDYLILLNKCNRQCQICSCTNRLVVDHCHSSGKIRGILCSNCNSALGQFSDNIEYLGKAIEYLSNDLTNIKYNVKKSKDAKIDQICPITNTDSNLVVDHCHETNLVRGTIDFNVNIGIGLFNDDINTVKSAISYLNKINS